MSIRVVYDRDGGTVVPDGQIRKWMRGNLKEGSVLVVGSELMVLAARCLVRQGAISNLEVLYLPENIICYVDKHGREGSSFTPSLMDDLLSEMVQPPSGCSVKECGL